MFDNLIEYLESIPGVKKGMGKGQFENGNWWIKLRIDIQHPLAWYVVQGLGFVLNYISVTERLPTIFMPLSPAPYLNGSPQDFLSWVIESREPEFSPEMCLAWLQSRLPEPVTDEAAWHEIDDET